VFRVLCLVYRRYPDGKTTKKSNKKRCNGKGFKANGAAVGKIDALQAKKPGQVTQCAMFEDECYILFNLP
jgi:hypothetical protein